jgi:5-methylcytosine-specific restriction protein B
VDGEALLDMLHGRGNRDSLAYWLEFKDDDELPARFGSISGGSALKFGIYQAKETGHWMTGHPTHQKRLTTEEAVAKVRHQRDQLIAGCSVLEKYASNPDRADYQALQREMQAAAPDLAESAWGHKYFSMLYPMLLDDYHGAPWQQYHLTKLLAVPGAGRYENAKGFLDVARQLEIPINSLTETLNVRDGDPHAYWSVDADAVGEGSWEIMSKEGCVTLAWSATGDLSDIEYTQIGKDGLRERVMRHFALEDRSAGRIVNQLFKLAVVCSERDIVLATRGRDVIGIGRITGGYSFAGSGDPAAHRRPVEWISSQPWLLSFAEGSKQAFYKLGNFRNIVEVERQLLIEPVLQHAKSTVATPSVASEQRRLPPLEGVVGRAQQILERKRQMILFGPPGTGKTYWAERTIKELVARSWFRVSAGDLNREMIETLRERKATETCSFHAAYGYEDFLEGYRPTVRDGQLAFEPRDGIFKKLCARAAKDLEHQYFLLIDEINRGEIPRIFGELLTVLEFDRRGTEVTLPLSGSSFVVPQNVYIVGTMNTADRSVALVDAALRRRFGFIELMPDSSVLGTASVEGLPLGPWLDELNLRVLKHAGRDARNIQVGHSYLMQKGKPITDVNRFTEALRDDIVPLLQEYCYESYEALELILGPGLVDRERQRIRTELFEQNRRIDLVRTLLTSFDEITATAAAVAADTGDDAEDAGLDAAEDEANDL